jgi:hypothetical protein
MRVSSLSNERIRSILSNYFVPTWLSRDRYQLDGTSKDEQAELQRIDRQRHDRGLEGGTVTVHILAADGTVVAAMALKNACDPEKLGAFLVSYIEREKLKPRANPRTVGIKTTSKTDETVLRVCTRLEDKGPNRGLSIDRVTLTAAQTAAFVPDRDYRRGSSFKLPAEVADPIFSYFYPPLPHYDIKKSKLLARGLTATVVAASEKEVQLRLEGYVELRYPNLGKPSDGQTTAKLLGTATVDPAKRKLTALAMTSVDAEYVWYWNGSPMRHRMSVAVKLEP